jgi:anti-sigma factor RsiW
MNRTYDDETLMAFADGALDEPLFSQVAADIEADAELAARLDALVMGKDLARAVYRPLAQAPVPRKLRQNVEAAIAAAEGGKVVPLRRRVSFGSWQGMAAAAAVACVVAGPVGFLLGQGGGAPQPLIATGPMEARLAEVAAAVPSGGEAVLADGTRFLPIASFEDGAGRFCREFELMGETAALAVACRPEEGWQVEMALAIPGEDGAFRPASSLPVLESYLSTIGAGAPMSVDEERAALEEVRR